MKRLSKDSFDGKFASILETIYSAVLLCESKEAKKNDNSGEIYDPGRRKSDKNRLKEK